MREMQRILRGAAGVCAVGLLMAAPGSALAQTAGRAPTFTKDVAPILQEKCQGCHRTGQMAPMALVTYEETRPWARSIKMRAVARDMPPWHMSRTIGIQEFMNDISLSDQQIETIARWVDAGAPRGDVKDMPAPKQWPNAERWRVEDELLHRPPDLLIKSDPWTQPAVGQDQWYQPEVESGLTEDRWIKAVEVRPTLKGRRITHHANTALAEFAVGKIGEIFRDGTALLMKAGEKVEFDIHYHSVGEEVTDFITVGVWFYPKGYVPKHEVHHVALGISTAREVLDIPPGKKTVHYSYEVLKQPTRIENFQPHMHFRGTGLAMEAIYPDGRSEMLSYVDRFNFNWHVNYIYTEDAAPVLPAGTVLRITGWHDNTNAKKTNPDPKQWVGWGRRGVDDMYFAHANVVHLTQEEYDRIIQERKQKAVSTSVSAAQ